jgi:hypothetical protein|tara:strand:- start:10339 stop:10734 length:396 start_codon:yes stop_codon:yes gene_type:complete
MSKYDPLPRGKCPLCKDYVWSDQGRSKDNKGVYRHLKCPKRVAGRVEELEMTNRALIRRAKEYERNSNPNYKFGKDTRERHLLAGFKLYLRLPQPRASIEEYGTQEGSEFKWTLSKLHNKLEKLKSNTKTL